jgi:hypothetical protein
MNPTAAVKSEPTEMCALAYREAVRRPSLPSTETDRTVETRNVRRDSLRDWSFLLFFAVSSGGARPLAVSTAVLYINRSFIYMSIRSRRSASMHRRAGLAAPWCYYCPQSLSDIQSRVHGHRLPDRHHRVLQARPDRRRCSSLLYTLTFAFTGGTSPGLSSTSPTSSHRAVRGD